MQRLDDAEKGAIWQATWKGIPLIACSIIAFNALPSLILWKAFWLRSWVSYLAWVVLSTALTAVYTADVGPVRVNGEVKDFWAPWQAVIACVFNLVVVCGVLWLLMHLPG
jgi:hypothetical protein